MSEKITTAQRVMLIRDLWPKVCAAQGWNVRDDDRRHDIYERLHTEGNHVGKLTATRMSDFSRRRDVDIVVAEFRSLISDTDLDGQLSASGMARQRAMHTIRSCPAEYVHEVCKDRFHGQDPDVMSDRDVARLAMTLCNRARRRDSIGHSKVIDVSQNRIPLAAECPF